MDSTIIVPEPISDTNLIKTACHWLQHCDNVFPPRPMDRHSNYKRLVNHLLTAFGTFQHFGLYHEITINSLFQLYQCYGQLGDDVKVLYTIWDMIYLFPQSPLGYILAGKFYNDRNLVDCHDMVYRRAMETITNPNEAKRLEEPFEDAKKYRTELPKQLTLHASGLNPLTKLMPDVVNEILLHLDFRERVRLQLLNRQWYDYIRETPLLWEVLDYRTVSRPVRQSNVEFCLQRSGGIVQAAFLENILKPDTTAVLDLVLRDENAGILRTLHIGFCTKVFNSWKQFSPSRWEIFKSIESLKLPLDDSKEFVYLLGRGHFPKLKELFLFGDKYGHVDNFDMFFQIDSTATTLPNLRIFRIGSQISTYSLHDRTEWLMATDEHEGSGISLDPISLNSLTNLMPNLEALECIRINFYRAGKDEEISRFRLNFSQNTKLKLINLTQCQLHAMPTLPVSCETLLLDATDSAPRMVTVSEQGSDECVYLDALINEDPTAVDSTGYSNVDTLDLSYHENLTPVSLIYSLASFNSSKLTKLSLKHYNRQIPLNEPIGEELALLSKWSVNAQENVSVMHCLVRMFPNLQLLNLSCTVMNDQCVKYLRSLDQLIYLDLYRTKVTFTGVWYLLSGEWNNTLASDFFEFPDPSHVNTNIKAVYLLSCPYISDEIRSWLTNICGIDTGYNFKNSS
ncbi:hypothetical protein V1511DRAFT_492460 [Dipodascopsis uninucleata]